MDEEEERERRDSREKFTREREYPKEERRPASPERRPRDRPLDDRERSFARDRGRFEPDHFDYGRSRERDFGHRSHSRSPNRDRPPYRDYPPPGYPNSDQARRRRRDSSPSQMRRDSSPSQKRRKRDEDRDDWERESPELRRTGSSSRRSYSHDDSKVETSFENSRDIYDGPLKSYKQFLETQPDNITPSEAERRYDEYKSEYKKNHSRSFYYEHRNEDWFKEKYDPTILAKKRADKLEASKKQVQVFREMLDSNFNFSLSPTDLDIQNAASDEIEEGEHPSNALARQAKTEGEAELSASKETSTEASGEESKLEEDLQQSQSGESKSVMDGKMETNVIFIKTIPPSIGRTEIEEIFKKHDGFKRATLSEVNRYKNFHRLGWAHFDTFENAKKALDQVTGTRIKDFELMMTLNKQSTHEMYKKSKITPPVAAEDERITIDLEQAKSLVKQLDKEKSIEENPLFSGQYNIEGLPGMDQLDRLIGYLRTVHFFCYYCGEEFDDEEETLRKCGQKHLRGKKNHDGDATNVITDTWASSLDQRVKQRIEHPENPDILSGKTLLENKLEKFNKKNTVQIDQEKFRCGICSKLFCGDQYVRKHLNLKHAEEVEAIKKKAIDQQFFDNYLNDPKRITPQGSQQFGMGNKNTGQARRQAENKQVPFYAQQGRGRGQGNNRPRGNMNRGGGRPQVARGQADPSAPVDPRGLREYVDLDAPSEDNLNIDYGLLLQKKS